jgi:hypothetical protein
MSETEKWEVLDPQNPAGGKVVATERSTTGCRTLIARDCMAEYAELIAAAPELYALAKRYEAFEAMMILGQGSWFDDMPDDIYAEMMSVQADRNEAVAKAEGRRA